MMRLALMIPGALVVGALLAALPARAQEPYEAPGVVVSDNEVTLSAPLADQVIRADFSEGERFNENDVLVAFNCRRLEAQEREASAALNAARRRLQMNRELDGFGAIGRSEVAISQADVGIAEARLEALEELIEFCVIRAPFPGRVTEKSIDAFETTTEGQPMMTIIDDTALVIEMIAPSAWLRWLEVGSELQFEIAETGDVVDGRVTRIGAAVDPVSRTVDVVAGFALTPGRILPGMSGRVIFRGG